MNEHDKEIEGKDAGLSKQKAKARMKETPKLHVGDRVVALRRIDFENAEDVLKGDKGEITKIAGDGTVEVIMLTGTVLDAYLGRDMCLDVEDDRRIPRKDDDIDLNEFWSNLETKGNPATPYTSFPHRTEDEMLSRSAELYELLSSRRSCRSFSSEKDRDVRKSLRELVEKHEEENYKHRLKEVWRNDIKAVDPQASQMQGRPWQKPYIEQSAYVVCVFKQVYRIAEGGGRLPVYYPEQSVGISIGLFLSACHNAGLAALASYPMGAEPEIRDLLERPPNEKLCLLVPVGLPAVGCTILDNPRKPIEKISVVI